MKVLLVNSNIEDAPYPVAPIGLCLIATEAEKAGYQVKLFDGLSHRMENKEQISQELLGLLKSYQPHVVGVSIRNIDDVVMENTAIYVDEVERFFIDPVNSYGNAIKILGGAGYSLFPEELLKRWEFDFGIVGPGEKTFVKLLQHIKKDDSNLEIDGLLKRDNSGTITGNSTIEKPESERTLKLTPPKIDLRINFEPYQKRSAYPLQTKRGCSLKCLYCSYPVLEGKKYQLRTATDVVNEIEEVTDRLPDTVFEFVDSTFNHPPGHAENICAEIIRRGLKPRLRTMGVNPSGITHRLLELMSKAGFAQIDCTPDSASDKMLNTLQKGFTRKTLENAARIIKEVSMPTMWFFLLGGPGEDDQTLNETFQFIEDFIDEHDLVHLSEGLRIYPKTGLEKIALEEGIISEDTNLLTPHFYVSQSLGATQLKSRVKQFTAQHYNCLRSVDSTPSPEMIKQAFLLRKRENITLEPMFRTLLRIRKQQFSA